MRDQLGRENVNQAGGSLYEEEARYLVRSRNEFEDLDDVLATVILADGGRLVTLGDVATVERGHKQRDVITRFGVGIVAGVDPSRFIQASTSESAG